MVAGLLAALMSSLAGVFNASSTLFTMDLYQKWRPRASKERLVWVGRVATSTMVAIGLLWIPVIQGSRGLYQYPAGCCRGYLAPPIFTVFFLGVFMKRVNAPRMPRRAGSSVSCWGCSGWPSTRRCPWGWPASRPGTPPGSFLWIVNNIYFQYYSLFIFAVSVVVMVAVSYLTEAAVVLNGSRGLTYATVTDEHRAQSRTSWGPAGRGGVRPGAWS